MRVLKHMFTTLLTVRNADYWGPTDRILVWPTDRRRSNFLLNINFSLFQIDSPFFGYLKKFTL